MIALELVNLCYAAQVSKLAGADDGENILGIVEQGELLAYPG